MSILWAAAEECAVLAARVATLTEERDELRAALAAIYADLSGPVSDRAGMIARCERNATAALAAARKVMG